MSLFAVSDKDRKTRTRVIMGIIVAINTSVVAGGGKNFVPFGPRQKLKMLSDNLHCNDTRTQPNMKAEVNSSVTLIFLTLVSCC